MSRHLMISFAISIALHSILLIPRAERVPHTPQARLNVSLAPPNIRPALNEPAPAESLLKNTMSDGQASNTDPLPPPTPPTPPTPQKRAPKVAQQQAEKKLSQHLYYPKEAVLQGLEGEPYLILKIGEQGRIEAVILAASSGHAILDEAAIKAAYAIGKLRGAPQGEIIISVPFRLE